MKIAVSYAALIVSIVFMGSPAQSQDETFAFVNVNLIPMDHDGIIPAQTVIVHGANIENIGDVQEVTPPSDATVIDGSELYLMPGLIDAHVHLDNKIGARADFGDAPLYLAYGITTVFNMRGETEHLDWKKRIHAGALLAPTLYTSGEFVNEPRIKTPEEAEQEVENHICEGYDIIKYREVIDFEKHRILTTTGLAEAAYLRLSQAARQAALPLIGHAPYNLGLGGLLEARQSLAHMNELANLYFFPPLELNKGTPIQTVKWSFIILVAAVLFLLLGKSRHRALARFHIQGSRHLNRFRRAAAMTIPAALICFLLWMLVVPPGLFFGNLYLLIGLSILDLFILVLVVTMAVQNIKMWRETAISVLTRTSITVISLVSISLCIGVTHWVIFAWRGSDMMINRVARECKTAGIWIQSTLICQEIFYAQKDGYKPAQIILDPAFHYVPAPVQESWRNYAAYKAPRIMCLWKRHPEFLRKLTFVLSQNGVPLMAGTDAMGAPLIIPGISLHRELQLLLESGLSTNEVLWTATAGPAEFLGKEDEFGTITIGKRADLILIEKNPLNDLNNLLKLKGIMVRGIWLPNDTLKQMLDQKLVKE